MLAELESHGVLTSSLRVVDCNVMLGVQPEMADGDAPPGIRKKMLAADILVFAATT